MRAVLVTARRPEARGAARSRSPPTPCPAAAVRMRRARRVAQRAAPPRAAAMAVGLRVLLLLPLLPPGGEGQPGRAEEGPFSGPVAVFRGPALLGGGSVCWRSSWFCLRLRYWVVVPAGRLGRGSS